MEHFGYLSVQTLSAGGALPIPDALVKIESSGEYDRIEPMTSLTDRDGKSEIFTLPAPPSALSLTPTPTQDPMSLYKVSVFKDGYYNRVLDDVPIYENIYSTLTVLLVPESLYNQDRNRPITLQNDEDEEGAV